jgi:hypothetical protein
MNSYYKKTKKIRAMKVRKIDIKIKPHYFEFLLFVLLNVYFILKIIKSPNCAAIFK